MNSIDYVCIAILILSMGLGCYRGLFKELMALAVWGIALFIAIYFSPWLINLSKPYINDPGVRCGLSFFCLFVATFLLMAWLARQFSKLIEDSEYNGANRTLGTIFGLLRGIIILAVLLLIGRTLHLQEQAWWQHSILIKYFTYVADWLNHTFGVTFCAYVTEQKNNLAGILGK